MDIIVDRRLMRFLGLDKKSLYKDKFHYKAVTSSILNEGCVFFGEVIDSDEIGKIKDDFADGEVTCAHDADAIIEDECIVESDAEAIALHRSTFNTVNFSTKGSDDDHII